MLPGIHLSLPALGLLLLSVHGRDGGGATRNLKLQVVNGDGEERGVLKLIEGSTLNLTCSVASPKEGEEGVKLSWYLPNNMVRPGTKRYRQEASTSMSTLVIDPVIETDTGDYECWARQDWGEGTVKTKLKVLIEPRRGSCQPGQYQCEGAKQYCISTRYRCDNRKDCPLGDDEKDVFCGYDPCKGKLVCPELDNRCIDPQEYCCDPSNDPECKFTYSCCEALLEFSLGTRLTAQFAKQHEASGRQGELGSLRYTVYTVVGCAGAFLLIVLGLGLAICRLHLQRKTRAAVVRGAGRSHPPITLHDLDIYFSERGGEEEGELPHIGITYNINHGVQILGGGGRGVPPPYSTTPRGAREEGRRGPPPPYRSSEHLPRAAAQEQAPLLEDGNNNGDINGNSDMADNNAVVVEEVGEGGGERGGARGGERERGGARGEGRVEEPPPRYPGLDPTAAGSSSDSDSE